MGKENKHLKNGSYRDPFMSPRANPKHAFHQVNGETQQTQRDIVLEAQTRKLRT
ncbi:YpzG family protein [Shouchella shacheensis]|uniref:YpzG family protein n=1 Tax=Shouchella shacheensis TaxID=1649580 RepID=UPI0009E72A40|nr:YpzG family protein [Shouchella shacheensis]